MQLKSLPKVDAVSGAAPRIKSRLTTLTTRQVMIVSILTSIYLGVLSSAIVAISLFIVVYFFAQSVNLNTCVSVVLFVGIVTYMITQPLLSVWLNERKNEMLQEERENKSSES